MATESLSKTLESTLRSALQGEVRFDRISRAIYSTDASIYQIMPQGVVLPRCVEDVVRTVRTCRRYGVPITARGGGTSQAGQAIGSGLQLDFSKYMNRILELDVEGRTVVVEPGIVLDELNLALKPHGLVLPLDLSTSNRATVGGAMANNSAGTRSVVYGKTIDYVLELDVVLSDGSQVHFAPVAKEDLDARCRSRDLEGHCYRMVRYLARRHAQEIDRRYPKILRRVGGYNLDDFVPTADSFNLSRIMVGSEGTLGLAVAAKLRLVPLPKRRVLCSVQFEGVLDALDAVSPILEHGPSAVELLDRFILDTTKGKTEYEPLRDFIVGDPGGVLLVEFTGDTLQELAGRVNRLEADLANREMGSHFHRALEPDAQARIWRLRKAGLGLSMSQRGDAKAHSFVEDTAVAPEHLKEYIRRFMEVLERNETRAGFYAHASVGLLHVRPVVDLKTAGGVEKFSRIAGEVADLVLEYGGALSAEHGDGLVRSPFQEKMYGPVLYQAFRRLKAAFDPAGVFNPGKIVDAPPITENLKFGTDYTTRELETVFDFSDYGGISRAAEQCSGVGACRQSLTATMCPSYRATRDETDVTRGRANALRLAISGQLGPDGLADKDLYPVLDLCLECKACKTECPTSVDMARLKSEYLYHYHARHGAPLGARVASRMDLLARMGSRLAPVSNWLSAGRLSRWLNEKILGLDRRRRLPDFAGRTFLDWWARHREGAAAGGEGEVAVFADTFTNYFEPQHAVAAVRVARRLGARVVVPSRVCCGRPLISKGFLRQAVRQAEATTRTLIPLARRGIPIVFCEPSCYSAVSDDHPHLVPESMREQAQAVARAARTFEEWCGPALEALPEAEVGGLLGNGLPKSRQILLHGHCHQKALGGMGPAVELLSRIPGAQVTPLDSGCCGMAGMFGYERKHYDVSRAVGELRLFPALREAAAGTAVVAPGFSCRHQIDHFTDRQAVSSMELLASLMGEDILHP